MRISQYIVATALILSTATTVLVVGPNLRVVHSVNRCGFCKKNLHLTALQRIRNRTETKPITVLVSTVARQGSPDGGG